MPIVHEVMDTGENFDELMAEQDYRVNSVVQDSGFKQVDELRHPTRRLSIVNGEVERPERLLYKI